MASTIRPSWPAAGFRPILERRLRSIQRSCGRITLRDAIPAAVVRRPQMGDGTPQANAIFQIDDDISYTRPDGNAVRYDGSRRQYTRPGQSKRIPCCPPSPLNSWGRRLSDGKISWIATLVPQFDVSGVPSDNYTLSIVMIYDRPNSLDVLDNKLERVVTGVWQDTASAATGGEIYSHGHRSRAAKFGPTTGSWSPAPISYRACSTSSPAFSGIASPMRPRAERSVLAAAEYEMYATLMGQDWNTNFMMRRIAELVSSRSPSASPSSKAPSPSTKKPSAWNTAAHFD